MQITYCKKPNILFGKYPCHTLKEAGKPCTFCEVKRPTDKAVIQPSEKELTRKSKRCKNTSVPCQFCGTLVGRYFSERVATCIECKFEAQRIYDRQRTKRKRRSPRKDMRRNLI